MTTEITIDMTYHARVERADRIEIIGQVLGFSNPILEYINKEESKIYQLTSTGVILVIGLYTGHLITAFMATFDQAEKLYRLKGRKQVSPKVKKKIEKNLQKYSYLLTI